jgi:SAM-dependent methyltransferase
MTLSDQLHCPACKGHLLAESATSLRCANCGQGVPFINGIADFFIDRVDTGARPRGRQFWGRTDSAELFGQIKAATGDRWPAFLGDTIVFDCQQGQVVEAIATSRTTRGLLLLDTAMERLVACRTRLTPLVSDQAVAYASVPDPETAIRDSVADTVVCTGMLSVGGDVRAFLGMVHRALKPGGRAVFVMPNRRYWQAMCAAMAEALVRLHARDNAWPEGQAVALEIIAHTRWMLLHRDDPEFLSGLRERHLFDSEALEQLGHEAGFATAEMIPLDPDPVGSQTVRRVCRSAGAPDAFVEMLGAMVGGLGQPYFDLLGLRDKSASLVLWLTKAPGPRVQVFGAEPVLPSVGFIPPEAALGGVPPRWSVELLARDTDAGIVVKVGGWCLCNVGVRWVRVTLDRVAKHAAVWRPRPDVHDVLNGRGLFYPINAICSGLEGELLFPDVHPTDNTCPLRLEIVLTNNLVVAGVVPEHLVMGQQMVVAH